MNDRVKRLVFRLVRIVLIVLLLMLGLVVMYPQRFLPPDMTLGEFFQGLLGAIFLAHRIVVIRKCYRLCATSA